MGLIDHKTELLLPSIEKGWPETKRDIMKLKWPMQCTKYLINKFVLKAHLSSATDAPRSKSRDEISLGFYLDSEEPLLDWLSLQGV